MRRSVAPSHSHAPTATSRLVRPLLLQLHTAGVDVAAWLRECGVPPGCAFDADARIPVATLRRLWSRAEEITGDPLLATRAVTSLDVRMIDLRGRMSEYVLVHTFANSPDVGSGLARFARFYALALADARVVLSRSQRALTITFRFDGEDDGPSRANGLVEYVVGTLTRMVAATTEPHVAPVEVWFAHPGPVDTSAHQRAFGAPVRFGATTDGVRYASSAARVPLQTADPAVLEVAEGRAVRELEAIQSAGERESLVERARRRIAAELRGGNPTAHAVAAQLGLSPRTLARRLAASSVTFKELLDDVRKRRAEEHLADGRLTVAEISVLLGFADASAFSRAYKRWFGAAPGERKQRVQRGKIAMP